MASVAKRVFASAPAVMMIGGCAGLLENLPMPPEHLFAAEIALGFLEGIGGPIAAHREPEMPGHIATVIPALAPHFHRALLQGTRLAIMDVGAHVGDFSSAVLHHFTALAHRSARARRLGDSADHTAPSLLHLIAVEPAMDSMNHLRARSGWEQWNLVASVSLQLVGAAARCEAGEHLFLHPRASFEEEAQLMRRATKRNHSQFFEEDSARLGESAPCAELETLLRRQLGPQLRESIFFLKLDAEGADIAIILGSLHILESVRFLGFEHSGTQLHRTLFRELRRRGFACYLLHPSGLLPLFGNVVGRVNWLLAMLPGAAEHQYGGRPKSVLGDVFCGRGCDEALPDVLRHVPRKSPFGQTPLLRSQPFLVHAHLMDEFQCSRESDETGRVASSGLHSLPQPTAAYVAEQMQLAEAIKPVFEHLDLLKGGCAVPRDRVNKAFLLGRELLFEAGFDFGSTRELGYQLVVFAASSCDPWAALLLGGRFFLARPAGSGTPQR